MTDVPRRAVNDAVASPGADVVPVFFLSDSTGISAETMGNALLIQFPDVRFDRTVIPFISSVEEARAVVARLDAVLDASERTPLVFTTAARDDVRHHMLLRRHGRVSDRNTPSHVDQVKRQREPNLNHDSPKPQR